MQCFIHQDEVAIATCKNCGKAMCANCSAYSRHSGVCPACRLDEFEKKREFMNQDANGYLWGIIKWAFICALILAAAIALFATSKDLYILLVVPAILLFIGGMNIFSKIIKRKKLMLEIEKLTKEIEKIKKALETGEILI